MCFAPSNFWKTRVNVIWRLLAAPVEHRQIGTVSAACLQPSNLIDIWNEVYPAMTTVIGIENVSSGMALRVC